MLAVCCVLHFSVRRCTQRASAHAYCVVCGFLSNINNSLCRETSSCCLPTCVMSVCASGYHQRQCICELSGTKSENKTIFLYHSVCHLLCCHVSGEGWVAGRSAVAAQVARSASGTVHSSEWPSTQGTGSSSGWKDWGVNKDPNRSLWE